MKKTFGSLFLVSLCLTSMGCESGGSMAFDYQGNSHGRATQVSVATGHVCGPGCDHFWDGSAYVAVRRHRHGPGCGHVMSSNRWIVLEHPPEVVHRPVVVERPVVIEEHRRSPTPHPVRVQEGPRRVEGHVDRDGAEVRVYDRRRGVYIAVERGHVHGPRCGHVHRKGRWETD